MKKKNTEAAPPRKYMPRHDVAFKAEAVEHYRRNNKSKQQVADELGVSIHTLRHWVDAEHESSGGAPLKTHEQLQGEVKRLQEELARVKEQRDILKKSLGILSEVPPSGMPESRR